MDWFQAAQFVAAVSTAASVAFAAFQLSDHKKQQRATFEDRLNEEYRRIVAELPLAALLNGRRSSDEALDDKALQVFYQYFDLCNEQLFLRSQGRISKCTWKNWRDGILQNMARPQFCAAWSIIARDCPGFFEKLRELVPPREKAGTEAGKKAATVARELIEPAARPTAEATAVR